MNRKHCPQCNSSIKVVKIGRTSSNRQRFKCKACGHTWTSKPHPSILAKTLWHNLVFHNLNTKELAEKYLKSERTIRRWLDKYIAPDIVPKHPERVSVIAMDVTYFGRSWGVLTVLDVHTGDALYIAETKSYETVWDYDRAIRALARQGVHPKAAIVDGKKGVVEMLEEYDIKVQFCQFHQLKLVTRYITRNPDMKPNQELRQIALTLTHTDEQHFTNYVYSWKIKYMDWITERTLSPDGKWEWTHPRTKQAIDSLTNNLPHLFTYQQYPELMIPNTNNKIEGIHSELKRRLANHRGLKRAQKIQFIRIFLSGRTEV